MISPRGRTAYALMTTLAIGSMALVACGSDRGGGQTSNEEPRKVATAMGTRTAEASSGIPSIPPTASMHYTAARDTTLTARALMEYLSEEQRERITGDGLDINTLTHAQKLTVFKVLETLLDEDSNTMMRALLEYIDMNPDAAPHLLKFSTVPAPNEQWRMDLEGPMLGLHAMFSEEGDVALESARFNLSSNDVRTVMATTGTDVPSHSTAHQPVVDLLDSLTDSQRAALTTPNRSGNGGLRGAALTEEQKDRLLAVATQWICVGHEPTAQSKQERIAATLDDTVFTLTGVTGERDDEGLQLRIDGPEVFIEFHQSFSEDGTPSIQSVFEDPSL